MTSLRQHRRADWRVVAVFDPDGQGRDFAYTIGLVERGLPELHLWARPCIGDDPGADWKLSPRDCHLVLNETAWRLIDGDVTVGAEWERGYDAGLATVRFRLDPPGDRDELEALLIAPDAHVMAMRWSLHRRPVGRPRPPHKRALARATSEYADLLVGLGDSRSVPEGWALPSTFTPGGQLGPMTPMAAGRIAQLWNADADTLGNLHWTATAFEIGCGLGWQVGTAYAVARDCGRVDEAQRTQQIARDVVDALTARPEWSAFVREQHDDIDAGAGTLTLGELESSFVSSYSMLLWVVLSAEVVADRLTVKQRLEARGAWLSGLAPIGELPGPQWRAPRPVLDRLYAALRPLGMDELCELARRYREVRSGDEGYDHLAISTLGWSFIAPAGCPWRGGLDRLGFFRALDLRSVTLHEWATVMTSAACHRERLSAGDVATLTAPYLDLVPELSWVVSG